MRRRLDRPRLELPFKLLLLLLLPGLLFRHGHRPAFASSNHLLRAHQSGKQTARHAAANAAGHAIDPPVPPVPFDYVKEPYTRDQSSDLALDGRTRETPSLPLPATWRAPSSGVCGPLVQQHCKQEVQAANRGMLDSKDAQVKRTFQAAVFPVEAECGRMFCNPLCLKGAIKCTVSVAGKKSRVGEQISQTQYMDALCAQVIAAVCTGSSSGSNTGGCCMKDAMVSRWVEDAMYNSGVRRNEDEFDEATMSRDEFDPTNRGYSGTWRRVKKGAHHIPDVIPLEKGGDEVTENGERAEGEQETTPAPPEGGRYELQTNDAAAALSAAGVTSTSSSYSPHTLNDPASTVPLLPLPVCRYSGAGGTKALFQVREARCEACMKEVKIKLEPNPVFCAGLEAPLPNGLPRPFKKGNGEERLQGKRFKNTELTDEPEKDWGGGGYGGVTRYDIGKMTSMWTGLKDMQQELGGHTSLYERCVAFVGALRTTGWLQDWEAALGQKKREVCGCLGCCDPEGGGNPEDGQCFFPFFQQ